MTTAREVLDGIDLTGTTALVTGGYSGLGLETTRALAGAGARVLVPARRPDVARAALLHVPGVAVGTLDLSDLDSVNACADAVLRSETALDIVIAGAGIMAVPETRVRPGWESQFATNHLGHYALVCRLWPLITAAKKARVVAVTSGLSTDSQIRWDDLMFEHGYDKWAAYGQSKYANALFARQLDVLGRTAGVRAFSASPGYILTPLQRHLDRSEMIGAGWIDADGTPAPGLFVSPAEGAATAVWAATSPALDGEGGDYCVDCAIGDRSLVRDDDAKRLWALSAELTGVHIG